MGGAPISASALAVIKSKAARIPRAQVEAADESFAADEGDYLGSDDNRDRRDDYSSSSRPSDRYRSDNYDERDRDYRPSYRDDGYDDMRDGDGYGDGYGAHANEYEDRYREDDRVYGDSDVRRYQTDNDRDYLAAIHEPTDGKYRSASSDAQPKKMASAADNGVSLDDFRSPLEYEPPSRLPSVPDTLETFNFRPILKATYRELRNFVLSPLEPGIVVRCYIERNRSGSNMMSPFYSFCADLEDGTGRELMVCKKAFYSMQSHHIFSLKGEDLYRKREQRSRLYLGKLRGNKDRSNFVLYDNGNLTVEHKESKFVPGIDIAEAKSAGDAKAGSKDDATSLYRKELCVINYNDFGRPAAKGKRGCEVAIPATFLNANTQAYMKVNAGFFQSEGKLGKGANLPTNTVPPVATDGMVEPFERSRAAGMQNVKQTKHIFVMHERTSKYDPISSCLVDFKARANVASTKNCQFIESSPQESADSMAEEYEKPFLMQMGKTTDDCFNIDVKYPFSLLQAFAVCISRFDASLKWSK
eukprot:GSChrysophyteH1.ASY1.ANO1.2401.1 assembled CDS